MFCSISYSSISSLYSKSPALININSNELLHYSFTSIVNNCGGSCHMLLMIHMMKYMLQLK